MAEIVNAAATSGALLGRGAAGGLDGAPVGDGGAPPGTASGASGRVAPPPSAGTTCVPGVGPAATGDGSAARVPASVPAPAGDADAGTAGSPAGALSAPDTGRPEPSRAAVGR
ncbi:hypothetical protein V6U77_29600, partial [Micromonospora sp. CPCC 205546]